MVGRRPEAAHDGGGRWRPTASLLPLLPAAAAFALAACELTEVSVPLGDPIIVVHAVMRPDLPSQMLGRQFVIVERTFTGDTEPIEDPVSGDSVFQLADNVTIPYGGGPSIPIEGARVTVTNLDDPDDPCGEAVFTADPEVMGLFRRPGLYWGPENCPTMRAGDRLRLRVETPGGEVVTGTTRIPGMSEARFAVAGVEAEFDRDLFTTFNRDHDTLRFQIGAVAGRLRQLEVRRRTDLADFGTKIFADTGLFVLPGDLINTFVIGDEDFVFRGGRDYAVTVAVTDTNYFDFARSDNNRFTGRGFINHLEGGFGVFGSMVAATTNFRAVADVDDVREGTYRVTGAIVGIGPGPVPIDLTWELYLRTPGDPAEFSAFVSGDWLYGPIATSADGRFDGDRFTAAIVDTLFQVRRDTLRGRWTPDGEFAVAVVRGCPPGTLPHRCAAEIQTLGVLQMEHQ